jgi:hypothetical protein
MYFEPFQRVNAANTGFPCPKVPIRRKLRLDVLLEAVRGALGR